MLYANGKSPIVALNRVVVYQQIHGSKRALKEVQKANKDVELEDYYLYHSLLGNLYKSLQEYKKAKEAYTKAISLTNSQTEKNKLKSYLEGLVLIV
jgi:RNA polymerase sigma-70 factor (ECF subfamily)